MPTLIASRTAGSLRGALVTLNSSVTVLPGAKNVWLVALSLLTKMLFTLAMSLPAQVKRAVGQVGRRVSVGVHAQHLDLARRGRVAPVAGVRRVVHDGRRVARRDVWTSTDRLGI